MGRVCIHYYDVLRNMHVTEGRGAAGPLSTTAVPLHLTQFAVRFIPMSQLCACKTHDSIQFLRDVQCMVHASWTLG